jgi:hypothetical protein
LTEFLAAQGAPQVVVHKAAEPPELQPRSGKFRQVYSELSD